MQKIDPEGVAMRGRAFATSRRRKEYFVKGPNRVFSIDGHDKLSRFGFEIYGAIDAYSRYIVWCYVGISNRTAVSVNKQYLRLIRHILHMPKLIRSDKGNYNILYSFAKQAKYLLIIYFNIGTETVLLAQSHLTLRRAKKPDLPFHKAYSYGKSTKNQRIEAWWNLLTEGQTQEWKVFFAELEGEGLFDGGDIDKSCLQYIYMDIIRSHIHQFVSMHNTHRIRRQRLRAHYLPTGQSFLLYHYPDSVRNYQEPVDTGVLAALENEVKDFDLDEYLPAATMSLYAQLLSAGGFPTEFVYSDVRHKAAYLFLRERVADYLTHSSGNIALFNTPSGAEQLISAHRNHEIEVHRNHDSIMQVEETNEEHHSK